MWKLRFADTADASTRGTRDGVANKVIAPACCDHTLSEQGNIRGD